MTGEYNIGTLSSKEEKFKDLCPQVVLLMTLAAFLIKINLYMAV